ncbi:MAG: 3'-5' exonuclease [Ruminococcus sp.]|nr:3'-5' exonuclease [Ruminococcus sp.]
MKDKRDKKGKSRLVLPRDYCVVDIETTGLTPSDSEIIEIAAVRYRDLERVGAFTTFVKPDKPISDFIVGLTGISNEMVADAPKISEAIIGFRDFVGDDIIMGYNVNFDINFLYDALLDCCGEALGNDFVDVLRFARKALPNLERRSQTRVADHLRINSKGAHRAEKDCEICNAIYQKLMKNVRITEWLGEQESGDE